MEGYVDSKYLGYNKQEDIEELEGRSNIFSIISEYDEQSDTLTVRSSNSMFLPFFQYFITPLILIYFGIIIFRFEWNTGLNISENTMVIAKIVFMSILVVLYCVRFFNVRLYNLINLDFKNRLLTLQNVDLLGKYFIDDTDVDFAEIRKITVRPLFRSDKYIVGRKRRRYSIMCVETNYNREIPLFVFKETKLSKTNEKRIVDILNRVLKV